MIFIKLDFNLISCRDILERSRPSARDCVRLGLGQRELGTLEPAVLAILAAILRTSVGAITVLRNLVRTFFLNNRSAVGVDPDLSDLGGVVVLGVGKGFSGILSLTLTLYPSQRRPVSVK